MSVYLADYTILDPKTQEGPRKASGAMDWLHILCVLRGSDFSARKATLSPQTTIDQHIFSHPPVFYQTTS